MVNQVLRLRGYHVVLVVILLTISFLAYCLHTGRTRLFSTSVYSPLYSTAIYPLAGNARLTQDFEATYPGLYRIDLHFKKSGDHNDGQVVFQLKDNCEAAENLESFVIDYSKILNGKAYPFIFTPIDNSAGRRFCVVLEMLSMKASTQLDVYASQVDVYSAGTARYEANTMPTAKREITVVPTHFVWLPIVQKVGGIDRKAFDIGFNLHYDGPTREVMKTLLARLPIDKPYLFGTSGFYIFLFSIYLIALSLLWLVAFYIKSEPKL